MFDKVAGVREMKRKNQRGTAVKGCPRCSFSALGPPEFPFIPFTVTPAGGFIGRFADHSIATVSLRSPSGGMCWFANECQEVTEMFVASVRGAEKEKPVRRRV